MVEEDELRVAWTGRVRADKDVTRMGVTVDPAPVEDLRAEELDHGVHDPCNTVLERTLYGGSALCIGGRDLRGDVTSGPLAHKGADGAAVREPDTVDPLGNHDLLRREVRIYLGDVHLVCEARLVGDKAGGLLGVLCFELKVELTPEVLAYEVYNSSRTPSGASCG